MISFEQFLRIRETILTMIEKRGFNPEFINKDIDEHNLLLQYNSLSKDEDTFACDIFIKKLYKTDYDYKYENRNLYVHFVFNQKSTFSTISKNLQKLEKIYNLQRIDDIAIVICFDNLDEDSSFYKLQKDNILVFHHKNLAFDITKHRLVPQHIKIKKSDEKLKIKKDLKIDCLSKLPILLHTDAIAKFYHYRPGDIIKIIRPSNFGSLINSQNNNDSSSHTVYRYVM